VGFFRAVVRAFFKEIEVVGLEHIPEGQGGILVSWHPNGMVDPGLILTHFPQVVVFGARHGLFRVPMLGLVMRAVGSVPIYRAMDLKNLSAEERGRRNIEALDALAERVVDGHYSCLFPEGDSHDSSYVTELKTGAARFYYRARVLSSGNKPPVIIPVGLHYDAKRAFRSKVLVAFHPPISIPEHLDVEPVEGESLQDSRDRARALTLEIERSLREVVHATEDWELHHLMHRGRKLVRAERAHRAGVDLGPTDMKERTLGFARIWAGYYAHRDQHPLLIQQVLDRAREYDADLRALGLEDYELDRAPKLFSLGLVVLLLVQAALVYLLLPPLVLVGALINGPTALFVWSASKVLAKRKKDEASIKLLGGMVAFPTTWLAWGFLAAATHTHLVHLFDGLPHTPLLVGFVFGAMGFVGGALLLRYQRLTRDTYRALRVRLTRRRRRSTIERLRKERRRLCDLLVAMGDGVELPGVVTREGRVSFGDE
jgi:1-acyl-sn-glycerol-3-phosphate acyltransferase